MQDPIAPQTMLQHVLETIPASFFQYVDNRLPFIYEEVREAVSDPRYTPVEGRYLSGYLRRSLMENLFRKAAEQAQLRWSDVPHPQPIM